MRRLLAAALVLGFASTAVAQPESAYYGLALGSFDYQEEASPGFSGFGDTTDSWRLMVGYQLLEYLMVEGGIGKTSVIKDSETFTDPTSGPVTVNFNTEFQSLMIRMLGVKNFDSGLTVLGGIGWAEMNQDVDITFSVPGVAPASGDQDIGEPTYYAGVQYDLERFAVRLAFEKYDFSGGVDVEETTVTFFYKL
ncbi:MAG TPA: outer membrane beta-barrel protein [Gammaproteobacteria bacterium]|nr:outer membrane beta-barrel protein [Gammaproteobacteria bacterium]